MNEYIITRSDELTHHGIKGQKWGVRRYENEDGTLTPEGKIRYKHAEGQANKYKTTGSRIARTIGGGALGALAGIGLGVGIVAPWTAAGAAAATQMGMHFVIGLMQMGVAGFAGGTAITGLTQSIHAAKVRKGMDFINKYERVQKETLKRENAGKFLREGDQQ